MAHPLTRNIVAAALALAASSSALAADVTIYQRPDGTVIVQPAPATAPTIVERREVIVAAPDQVPIPAGPRVTLYERTRDGIRAIDLTASVDDLGARRFDRSASAALVSEGVWRLCDDDHGQGRCADFPPGRYDTLGALDGRVRSAYLLAAAPQRNVVVTRPMPEGRAVLYENPNFAGRSAVVEKGRAPDLDWASFKNPATSLRIESGDWLMCSEIGYQGECRVMGPGSYPMLSGLFERGIYSARQVWRPEYGSVR